MEQVAQRDDCRKSPPMAGSAQFEAELISRIEKEIQRLRDVLEAGQDIEVTRGRLIGLRSVIGEFIDDVNTKLHER